MSVKEIYPNTENWIKAEDLNGKAVKVIIETVELEEIADSGYKIVLGFEHKEKTLVLNKTNARCLAASFGDDEKIWIDKEIVMFPTTTEYAGKTVPCIRVRIDVPVADDEEEIPF